MAKAKKVKKVKVAQPALPLEKPEPPRLMWGLQPTHHKTGWAEVDRWEGQGGPYHYRVERVVELFGGEGGFSNSFVAWRRDHSALRLFDGGGRKLESPRAVVMWAPVEKEKGQPGYYPRRYRSLEVALAACEEHMRAALPEKLAPGNMSEVVTCAESHGLDGVPARGSEGTLRRAPVEGVRSRLAVGGEATPASSRPAGRGTRYEVMGFPVTAVLRWMGANDFTYTQAVAVLVALKVPCADNTVRIQLRAGKVGGRGEPAALSEEQAKQLREVAK